MELEGFFTIQTGPKSFWSVSRYIKLFCVLENILFTFVGLAVGCELERNEFNKYPWLLKLVVNGSMLGPGSLVTPYKVMSAAAPFHDILSRHPVDLSPIDFVGFRLTEKGIKCSATRKAVTVTSNKDNQGIVFWVFKKGFDVAPRTPFLWTSIDDIDENVIAKTVHEMKSDEQCVLPVFESLSSRDAKIKLDTANFISGIKVDHYLQRYCKYESACIKTTREEVFFASVTVTHMPGQVIICRNLAIGSQRLRLRVRMPNSNATEYGPAMYDNFGFKINVYHQWAVREWPKTPKPPKTNAPSVTRILPKGKNTKGLTSMATTKKPYARTRKKTLTGSPKAFFIGSSMIPSAPTMTSHKPTTRTTLMFVRTLPNRVQPRRSNISPCTDSPSTVIITLGPLIKMLIMSYFT